MSIVPRSFFIVKGKGYHKSKLGSFEEALRAAGIAKFNLVEISSVIPPFCIEIPKEEGLVKLRAGEIVYGIICRASSNKYNKMLSVSIGMAKPTDLNNHGYIFEHHGVDVKPEKVGEYAEDLAVEMLAATLGVPFDPTADYDEKQEILRMDGKINETKNIIESATVKEEGEWLTVLAAAIFIP